MHHDASLVISEWNCVSDLTCSLIAPPPVPPNTAVVGPLEAASFETGSEHSSSLEDEGVATISEFSDLYSHQPDR